MPNKPKNGMSDDHGPVPIERIERMILLMRGQKVMLDADLAELYGVETGALNRAVKRNLERFPSDFMFKLTDAEFENLKCQFGIASLDGQADGEILRLQVETSSGEVQSSKGDLRSQNVTSSWGGRRTPPYAFTEQGVAMLSSVLRSKTAVAVNIEIMRAFVRQRRFLAANAELAGRIESLEQRAEAHEHRLEAHEQTTEALSKVVFESLRQLEAPRKTESIAEIIEKGEGEDVEFKETFEFNIHTGQRDDKMVYEAVEAVAGFLNKNGGILLIGVSDSGEVKGLDRDFSLRAAADRNCDRFELHLRNHLQSKMEPYIPGHITIQFDNLPEGRICAIQISPLAQPVFLKRGDLRELRVREGNRTIELKGQDMLTYISERFSTGD